MTLFPGRVDIHRPGGAATRDEGPTGEQHGAEDQAELHQEHLHHHRVHQENSPVNTVCVD